MKRSKFSILALCAALFLLCACSAPADNPAASAPEPGAASAQAADVPEKLDEDMVIAASFVLDGTTSEEIERLKTESTWEFVPDSDTTGHLLLARGGTTVYALCGSALTVFDTGSVGDVLRVSVLDLAENTLVYDYSPPPEPPAADFMDETLAREIFIAAYGSSNEEIDTMQTENTWVYVPDSDSTGHLEIARGGSIEFLRNGNIVTMIDYGTFGPSRVVKYDAASGQILSDFADEG